MSGAGDSALFALPKPSAARAPGLMPRVDRAAVTHKLAKFDTEVRNPIKDLLVRLGSSCVMCILRQRPGWDKHGYDYCVHDDMKFGTDMDFSDFKRGFRSINGFCFGCLLQNVRSLLLFVGF